MCFFAAASSSSSLSEESGEEEEEEDAAAAACCRDGVCLLIHCQIFYFFFGLDANFFIYSYFDFYFSIGSRNV